MGHRFFVHNLRDHTRGSDRDDLSDYLSMVIARLHRADHAEVRVYTCRSWRASGGATAPQELHWNHVGAGVVPGETRLGSYGCTGWKDLVEPIEAEFAKGDSVRLFIFNSDADLCFEEVLVPLA